MSDSAEWDVFISHSHLDEAAAARVAAALSAAGLRVYRAAGAVDAFASISTVVIEALQHSRILLACYSADYPTRTACQHEFATAYLAGQAEGDPLRRVVAVNLERTISHIEPRQLRDMLLPSLSSPAQTDQPFVKAVQTRVAALPGFIGEIQDLRPHWVSSRPVYPPPSFVGRWYELWRLHSALHPTVGPLTSPPGAPIAVVHGPAGIGKTALAAEYVRRFGSTFPGGISWTSAEAGGRLSAKTSLSAHQDLPADCLHVIDDVSGDIEQVAAILPPTPGTPTLILTRDAQLTKLGVGLALRDLNDADSALLIATLGATQERHDPAALTELSVATAGSPEVRARTAGLAAAIGVSRALDQLHDESSDLLVPLLTWMTPEFAAIGESGRDILRMLAAASPTAVPILRIADVLASIRGTKRQHEMVEVQHEINRLSSRGLLGAPLDAVDLALPSALVLAVKRLERNPRRAEQIRIATIQLLVKHPDPDLVLPSTFGYRSHSEDEVRAAHRIQTELAHRITGHPLEQGQGSLRDALTSLHSLVQIVRAAQGSVHPSASWGRQLTEHSLEGIVDRLINGILRRPLTYWHIELSTYEDLRPAGVSRIDHERRWEHNSELRQTLRDLHRQTLSAVEELSHITGNSYAAQLTGATDL